MLSLLLPEELIPDLPDDLVAFAVLLRGNDLLVIARTWNIALSFGLAISSALPSEAVVIAAEGLLILVRTRGIVRPRSWLSILDLLLLQN